MKYVGYIESNVKGGVACELGQRTLLTGLNGTGKSGVINALELALSGSATDLAGRAHVKDVSNLVALTPDRKSEVWAKCVVVDAETNARVEAQFRAGGKVKKGAVMAPPDWVDPSTAFPLRAVVENVVGTPDRARKFLLPFVVPNLTWEAVLAEIPEPLHPHLRQATLKTDLKETACDKLLAAVTQAKKMATSTKAQTTGAEDVASAVADGLPPLPTQPVIQAALDEQKAAMQALDQLKAARTRAEYVESVKRDADPIRANLAQAEANCQALEAALAQAQAQLAQTPAPAFFDEHTQRVLAIRTHCANVEAQAGGAVQCPVCKLTPAAGAFQQAKAAADHFIATEQAKAPGYDFARQQVDQLNGQLEQWRAQASQLRTQLHAMDNAVASGSAVVTPEAMQAGEARLAAATELVQSHQTLAAQWAQAKKATSASSDTATEAAKWTALKKACTDALVKLLDAAVSTFISRVQSFLPTTDRFHLQLRDGEKAVFQFGLLDTAGVLRTALSGAEWARVTAALASACMPNDGRVHLVVPEERAFDPQTLAATMEAFNAIPGQVIIASPIAPATVPAGWTVVDTTMNAHRTGKGG